MISKSTVSNKYKIITAILLIVSALSNILQKPIYNWLLFSGRETQQPIFTLSLFLFIINIVIFVVYILFSSNKIIAEFFPIVLAVNILSRIFSIFSTVKAIIAYSEYNANMEWVKPLISQYTKTVFVSAIYVILFLFLFIDALKKHKYLKTARIVILVLTVVNLISLIIQVGNYNNVILAIVSILGFSYPLALLTYYFHIADTKNKSTLENELLRLKSEYKSGKINDEEYSIAKQNVLNKL